MVQDLAAMNAAMKALYGPGPEYWLEMWREDGLDEVGLRALGLSGVRRLYVGGQIEVDEFERLLAEVLPFSPRI